MRTRELNRWKAQAAQLTPHQREQALLWLRECSHVDAVTAVLESKPPHCPHCPASRVVRNGQADGLQRFKCRQCGTSFNALTGTPLARLRHRAKWLQQAQAMAEGLSVRNAAAQMDVHRTTAFRWRHRFLEVACQRKEQHQQGVVEADETYVLRSYKGQPRRLRSQGSRPPRHRGGPAAKRGLSHEQVPILVVRNRSAHTSDYVLQAGDTRSLLAVLPIAVAPDAVLCTDGSAMLARAAAKLGIEHHGVNVLRGERTRGAWHIQNVNAYHGRFKGWLRRFKGVATSYLPNYLGWFRALERNARARAGATALLALAIAA